MKPSIVITFCALTFISVANAQLVMYESNNPVPKILPNQYKESEGDNVKVQLGKYKCNIDDMPDPSNGTRYTILNVDVGMNTFKIFEQTLPQVDIRYDDNHTRSNISSVVRKFQNEKGVAVINQQAMDSFILHSKLNGKIFKAPCYYNDK
ncbi:hypothetical protein [Leclercia adecarboxylata]|uniref:hypothetical protein n=1 Tax=Leclercia adecarboxylata TaxID=83655 RepID=UPI002B2D4D1A|nr:hypothetical protein NRF19_08205 [Leclercia adecarboxylata]